jgi:hypothetical protein
VKTRLGRGDQVAVSWRITGGRGTPAQDVPWSIEDGWLVVKLPAWACPPIRVLEELT